MRTDLGTAEGIESREPVHFVTQQTRFALINNILQHPEQLPSMYELEELNPSVSDATVYKHIQKLIDAGIVKEVALDDDQRRQGYPWKFYGLTEEGRTFLDEHNLLAAEETSNRSTRPSPDKPEKMVKYENPLARTTRNPYRKLRLSTRSPFDFVLTRQLLELVHAGSRSSSISPCVSR